MTLQELQDKRLNLHEQAKAILEGAAKDKREALKADEEETVQKLFAEMDRIAANIELRRKSEELDKSLAESAGRRSEPSQPGTEHRGNGHQQSRILHVGQHDSVRALQAWFLAGTDVELTTEQRDIAARCGVDLNKKQIHLRLPSLSLRDLRHVEEWERRALATTSGSVGGYTVPDETMRALEVALLQFGGMREVATVLRTDTGAALPIPTVDDTGNVGEIIGENTTINNQDVAFGQVVLGAFKYSSKKVLVSVELLQDNAINLASFLGTALGQRIGRITNQHFTTGGGTTEPNGIVTAATDSGISVAADDAIAYGELVDFQHSVDPAYRRNARWMFRDSSLAALKKLVDGDGRLIWQMNASVREPDTILGSPFVINQDVAAMGANAKAFLYGDLSKYIIRDVRDITLLRLDERYAELHQVAFFAFSRHDGDLLDAGTNPVKYLTMGS
jgi:HK97 family phage major capsid protein